MGFGPWSNAPAATQLLLVFHLGFQIQVVGTDIDRVVIGIDSVVTHIGFAVVVAQTTTHAQAAVFEAGGREQIAGIHIYIIGFSTVDEFFAIGFRIGIKVLIAQFGTNGVLLSQRDIGAALQGNAVAGVFKLINFGIFVCVAGGYGVAAVIDGVQRHALVCGGSLNSSRQGQYGQGNQGFLHNFLRYGWKEYRGGGLPYPTV